MSDFASGSSSPLRDSRRTATFFRGVLALPMIEVTEQILRMTFAFVVFSQFENSLSERKIIGAWLWISHSAKRLYDSSSQLGFFF